ncbi:hypothetical protein QJS10_CPB17g01713 [Acorus calamus]|uniref:Uncharacterized protein n=1 Tax=Acorus calamus TaxID=4465 RepID=A0AAV9CWU2_ACOCL|nr:hypothetical protein QJS10_CPB17g01713 [Acorus calamus]
MARVSFRILSNDQNSSRGADGESGRRTDQSEVDMFFLNKRAREAKVTVPGASHVRGGRDGGASGCRSASGTVRHRNLDARIPVVRFVL